MSLASTNASLCDAHASKSLSDLVTHSTRALRLKQVLARTGMCRSAIYAKAKCGEFPSPIKLGGGRSSAWLEHEVEEWLQQQILASRGGN
jgi:prophage regulatory protein